MTHPLTDLVKNLLTDARRTIDRYDVAIALGAPNDPVLWDAYLNVASDALATMHNEGNLRGCEMGPGNMVFELPKAPRPYAIKGKRNG